jgi:GPH family glycoside/pentoside/hexuronide:cation symporter
MWGKTRTDKIFVYLSEMEPAANPVPLSRKIAFAMGQTGWSLAVFGFTELIYFFYLPPDTGKPLFKAFVYQGPVLQVFTVVGLLSAIGYFISAFMEPVVGSLSDRSSFKFGKRKTFMAFALVPFALISALVFFPLRDGVHAINAVWLSATVIFAFIIKCFYTTPYNALINEISKNEKERLRVIMMISVAYAFGIGIGQTINIFIKLFEGVMSNEAIFKTCIIAYSSIAFILMSMPVLFVPDHSGLEAKPSNGKQSGLFDVMREVWADKNFRILVIVELIYWFPSKVFTVAVPYIVTALMKLDNVYTSLVLYACGIGSFLLYPLIDKLVRVYGKRKIMLSAFASLLLTNLFTATIGLYTMPTPLVIAFYVLFNMYPVAVLGILPMALAGDNAENNFKQTGVHRNASYYALKTFMMKIGVAITSLVFPSLLLLGKSPLNPLGVRMVAVACIITSTLAFVLMRKYRDV